MRRSRKRPAASSPRKPAATADLAVLMAASARQLALPIEPSWREAVAFNLKLLFAHAALVEALPLPDDTEPGPVFRA